MSEDDPFELLEKLVKDAATQDGQDVSPIVSLNCRECNSNNILDDHAKGYKLCGDCGVVFDVLYDTNPEWSQFDEGGCATRCGAPTNPLLQNYSLGTMSKGRGSYKINQLTRDHLNYDERARKEVYELIDTVCKKNKILQIVADTARSNFFKLCQIKHTDGKNKGKKIIFRGKNRLSIIAACVNSGAKKYQPINTKELAKMFSLDVKQVSKGIRHFMELMKDDELIKNLEISSPSSFIHSFCVRKLPKEYMDIAIELTENVEKLDLASNHQPNSIAAACILLLIKQCNINISKKDIIQEFKISEPTLNKTMDRLERWKNALFNSDITDKISNIVTQVSDDKVDTTDEDDIKTKLAQLNIDIIEKQPKQKRKKSKKCVEV